MEDLRDDKISEVSQTPKDSDDLSRKTESEDTLQEEELNDRSGFTEIYEHIVEELVIQDQENDDLERASEPSNDQSQGK